MNQPIIEVKERKSVLSLGIILIFMFGAFMVMSLLTAEDDDVMIICALLFGVFVVMGIYLLLAYKNHSLRIFAGDLIEYTNSIGRKNSFQYSDVSSIEQKYVKTTLNMTWKDTNGKRLAKIEGNMAGYEELLQWLENRQKATAESQDDISMLGYKSTGTTIIQPVKVQGTGKGGRIFLGIMGVLLLIAGIGTIITGVAQMNQKSVEEEAVWFDTYTEYEGRQMVEFEMISYPFASFEYSDAQGLYFVFDTDMCAYIVCLDNSRFETEFGEIYEYTFSESTEAPAPGVVEGYAMPIEEELKDIAIEEFNLLWNDEVLNEENFEEYLGAYYLDTTYQPGAEEESPVSTVLAGIFFLVMAIYMFYYVIKGYKKVQKKIQEQSSLSDKEEKVQVHNTVDLPIPRNIFVTLLAVIIGAALGGVLWIFFYKLGRIAAISGYLAVMGAVWGWNKFGRRELTGVAWVLCILAGAGMIIFANCISYAWEVVEVINASSPGRAEFLKVLFDMPSLMTEWDLWGGFIADLGIGLFFALVAGITGRFGKKKQKK